MTTAKRVPRNILLMEELESCMKGQSEHVSIGIVDGDITLTNWYGSIIDKNYNILFFNFVCTKNFPNDAPVVTFTKETMMAYKNYLLHVCETDGTLKSTTTNALQWNANKKLLNYFSDLKKLIDYPRI